MYICTYVYVYMYMCVYVYIYTRTYVYIYMHRYKYRFTYVDIHVYIHTYTYTGGYKGYSILAAEKIWLFFLGRTDSQGAPGFPPNSSFLVTTEFWELMFIGIVYS